VGPEGARRRIAAVIFDLDGVLVDSQVWWREIRDAWAAEHGTTWRDEDEAATMGANTRQWVVLMRQRAGLPASADPAIEEAIVGGLVARYAKDGAPRIPGAIEAARGIAAAYPIAIASGGHHRILDAALEAAGLADVVRVVVSADDVPSGKPDPAIYFEAARQLGVPASACLVVEDSLNGVRAGHDAGMVVVLVPNAKVPPAPGAAELADVLLDRLADLDPERLEAASASA
jgi:beta-phosphoglucomutase-like phosphatase (HAD superfamily)